MAVLYLFAFADHVLIKTLMHLLCCAMCQICFCCVFIAGCLASILIPFHLPGQCLSASALKRWEETSVTHQSWFDTESAFWDLCFFLCHLWSFLCVFSWDCNVRGVEQQVLQMWLWRRRIPHWVFHHWYRLFNGTGIGLHARYTEESNTATISEIKNALTLIRHFTEI